MIGKDEQEQEHASMNMIVWLNEKLIQALVITKLYPYGYFRMQSYI